MLRINMSAYLLDDDTVKIFKELKNDISLTRSNIDIYDGGIDGAIENFQKINDSVDLLVVQSDSDNRSIDIDKIIQLSQVVQENTKVILISKINDVNFYKEIVEMGVGEYLNSPIDKISLLKSIRNVCGDEHLILRGKTIAFVGAKGGVGSSCISHNIAHRLAKKINMATTLIDMDLFYGTVGIDFQQEPRFGLRDALERRFKVGEIDNDTLEQVLLKQDENLWLLSSNPSLELIDFLDDDIMENVLDTLAKTTKFMILDMPHSWNSIIGNTLIGVDELFIVSDTSLTSLRNTQMLFETLIPNKPSGTHINYIVNMNGIDKNSDISLKDFEEALGLAPVAVFPFNTTVFRGATAKGEMIESDNNKKNKDIYTAFDEIEKKIIGKEKIEAKVEKTDFLEKIKSFFQEK